MVLLIVRAVPSRRLSALVDATLAAGMAPVVEAADARELESALATSATIIGVNARDLGSFQVDTSAAQSVLAMGVPARPHCRCTWKWRAHTRMDFLTIRQVDADCRC